MINYNHLFFKTRDPSIKNVDIFKRFGTFYALLIDLLNGRLSTLKAAKERNEMIKKQKSKKIPFYQKKKSITKKNTQEKQRKEVFAEQKGILKNALRLFDKINDIINAFLNEDIVSGYVERHRYYTPKDLEPKLEFRKRISGRTKMGRQKKSDKENQKGQGPKKLTLDQKLSRLPITLAQLKAGNSSEKLKK